MTLTPRMLLFTVFGTTGFLALAVLGEGGLAVYFAHAPLKGQPVEEQLLPTPLKLAALGLQYRLHLVKVFELELHLLQCRIDRS